MPEWFLTGTILVVLVADLFLPRERKWVCMPIAFVGVIGALIAALTLINANRTTFGGMYVVDNFAVLFKVFFLSTAAVVLGLSLRYMRDGRYFQGEYYVLLLAAVLGSGHLRWVAGPGGGVLIDGVEGRRLRRAPPVDVHRVRAEQRLLGSVVRCPVDRHDDHREPGGAPTAAGGAAVRLFVDRAGGIHAAAVRPGRSVRDHRRRGVPGRRDLHPHLLDHEPRRVRRSHVGGPGGAEPAGRGLLRANAAGPAHRRLHDG